MKLFICNLPFILKEEEVRRLLDLYGNVRELKLICHKETGKSRGYAFAEIEEIPGLAPLPEALGTLSLYGRSLYVTEAVDKAAYLGKKKLNKPKRRNRIRLDDPARFLIK